MKVILQIGFRKATGWSKDGQLIKAYVNDEECVWKGDSGKWLTSFSESGPRAWYLWEGDLKKGDLIRLEIRTGLLGKGVDEKRTLDMLYEVDPNVSVKEIKVYKVGHKGYPILKGRVRELANVSEEDKREQDIDNYLEEGFDEPLKDEVDNGDNGSQD